MVWLIKKFFRTLLAIIGLFLILVALIVFVFFGQWEYCAQTFIWCGGGGFAFIAQSTKCK